MVQFSFDIYFPLQNIDLRLNALVLSLSWFLRYWWVYASNFLIYVVTTRDFRTIYRLFLGDMATKLGAHNLAAQILPD